MHDQRTSRVLYAHVLGERTLGISGLPPDEMLAILRDHLPDELSVALVAEGEPPSGPPGGLSEREATVIGLICRGMSNQDVADHMFLSLNTIKTYIRTGYRKLGVTTRSQAVIWGLRHGLDSRHEVAERPLDDVPS